MLFDIDRIYFKHTFEYDSGNAYLEKTTIYEEFSNIKNTKKYYNKFGNIIKLEGKSNYIKKLAHILTGEYDPDIKSVFITSAEFDNIFSNSTK